MKQIFLIMLSITIAPITFADDLVIDKELRANFFRVNLVRSFLEIEHKEQSSDGGFEALGRRISLDENSFDFILGREFIRQSPISISLHVLARANLGSGGKENRGATESIDYEESLQGYGLGWGGSLNFNATIFKTRTQFYLLGQVAKQKNKYFLRYSDDDSSERSVEIQTDEEATSTLLGLGVRVYNLYNGYTFNIAVHKLDYTIDAVTSKASQGADTDYKLTKEAEFTRGNTAYSLGFGGTF